MKTYLVTLGAILVAVGILGFVGVIGPDPEHSPWQGKWYFDQVENFGHTLAGLALLSSAAFGTERLKRLALGVTAGAGLFAGFYSLAISNVILQANLQHPADTVFHFVIGTSALILFISPRKPAAI